MKKITTQFEGNTPEQARATLERYMGEQCLWFSTLLYDLKAEWIDRGAKVTDILIRETMPVMLAAIKAHVRYFPDPDSILGNNWTPSKRDMIAVVEQFYELNNLQKKNRREGEYNGLSLDFSISVDGLGIFRINYSEDINGSIMSIRILSYELPSFSMIGYEDFYIDYIKSLVQQVPQKTRMPRMPKSSQSPSSTEVMKTVKVGSVESGGLILHVGPTGSGKTTAIAAELNYLAENTTGGIITYESPIEYRYISTKAPVRQHELGSNIMALEGKTEMQSIPKHLLRSNPTVVMIGEARDKDEMKILLDIASRGHLVLSTIHSTNILEAITNLFEAVGEDKSLLSNALKAIVAHKLVHNENGEVLGLHEILIVDDTIRSFLTRDTKTALEGIKRQVYQEGNNEALKGKAITFRESLIKMEKKGKINFNTHMGIIAANYGIFVTPPSKEKQER